MLWLQLWATTPSLNMFLMLKKIVHLSLSLPSNFLLSFSLWAFKWSCKILSVNLPFLPLYYWKDVLFPCFWSRVCLELTSLGWVWARPLPVAWTSPREHAERWPFLVLWAASEITKWGASMTYFVNMGFTFSKNSPLLPQCWFTLHNDSMF